MSSCEGHEPDRSAGHENTASPVSLMFDVIGAPAEAFENLRRNRYRSVNWVWPGVLVVVIGIIGGLLVWDQPAIRQQMSDIVSEQVERQVSKMGMTEDQRAVAERFGLVMARTSMLLDPVVTGFVMPFWWGLVIWVAGSKLLGGNFTYLKGVEVAGLANTVVALELAARALLQVGFGNIMAGPHLGILVREFDPAKPGHAALAVLNVFSLWAVVIRGYGMARVGGFPCWKGIVVLLLLWLLFMCGGIGVSVVGQRLAGH
ncbi:MAG: YIP1 family protein [Verrucomicrobiae bacterium]|nr:YIP1 family protein [Verrucomicrobiae bacterium]